MQPKSRRAAWIQGVVLVGGGIALAVTLALRLQRPFDRDTLSIPVGELRSQAAEAGLLQRQALRDHLAPAFVRFHAQQLGHNVERARDALAGKAAGDGLEPMRHEALAFAASLQRQMDALGRDASPPGQDAAGFDATAHGLDALGKRIKPGS